MALRPTCSYLTAEPTVISLAEFEATTPCSYVPSLLSNEVADEILSLTLRLAPCIAPGKWRVFDNVAVIPRRSCSISWSEDTEGVLDPFQQGSSAHVSASDSENEKEEVETRRELLWSAKKSIRESSSVNLLRQVVNEMVNSETYAEIR